VCDLLLTVSSKSSGASVAVVDAMVPASRVGSQTIFWRENEEKQQGGKTRL
jgi:hypothetical protein